MLQTSGYFHIVFVMYFLQHYSNESVQNSSTKMYQKQGINIKSAIKKLMRKYLWVDIKKISKKTTSTILHKEPTAFWVATTSFWGTRKGLLKHPNCCSSREKRPFVILISSNILTGYILSVCDLLINTRH